MREILFRGKRIDNGEWIEGHLLWYEDGRARITPRHTEICYLEKDFNTIVHIAYEVIPESIGEFTSLTDKNGTKIFEGDIVIVDMSYMPKYTGVVVYTEDFFGLDIKDVTPIQHCIDYVIKDGQVEVIGNIHDNPELLKGGAE